MSATTATQTRFFNVYQTAGIVLLILGGLLAVLGLSQSGFAIKDISKAYFFGWQFWVMVTFGCTGLAILHHVVRAKWTTAMFRVWEAGGGWQMLILMAVLFAPLAFVLGPHIWPWMAPEAATDKILQLKKPYLEPWFFQLRYLLYFGILAGTMWRLSDLLAKEEKTGSRQLSNARNWFAPPMLAVFVLIINFSMTDWGMSLDPHWFSTMYGVWNMIGMAISGVSLGLLTLASQAKHAPFNQIVDKQLTKDIGHILLTFTMIWAYFSFSQYLIIWSGNLPENTPYYLARSINGYKTVGFINSLGSFVVPFLLLIGPFSTSLKVKPGALAMIAMLTFAFRFVDFHYIFSPSVRPGSTWMPVISDWGMVLLFGGAWLLFFSIFVRQKPLTTTSHPYQEFGNQAEAAHAPA